MSSPCTIARRIGQITLPQPTHRAMHTLLRWLIL